LKRVFKIQRRKVIISKNSFLVLLVVVLIIGLVVFQEIGAQTQSSFEKLLTVSDVKKVTGLKGIKLVPKDYSKRMLGDLNFVQQDGTLLLSVNFWDLRTFEMAKGQYPYKVNDLGNETFEGPAGSLDPYQLIFRKGDRAAALTRKTKPLLTQKQLHELAKIIASRM
jgi:hypothetical protein